MSIEIPSALITEIQSSLRNQAGIPSYDSVADDSFFLPFRDALSKIDDDDSSVPSYLRCSNCDRKLLRGIRSTLCVFCGHEQRQREGFSHSISFTSTVAYRNLLESLKLDGSEAINFDTESKDSSKSQETQNSGLVLSSLLDLELRWPTERKKTVKTDTNIAPAITPATNLSGVDLDTFFTDSGNEISTTVPVTSSDLMPHEEVITESSNSSLFENTKSSDVEFSETKIAGAEDDNSFAEWEPDFQTASSETVSAEFKSTGNIQDNFSAEHASPVITFTSEDRSLDLFNGSSGTEFVNDSSMGDSNLFDNTKLSNLENIETTTAGAEDDNSFTEWDTDFQDSFTAELANPVTTFTSEDESFDLFGSLGTEVRAYSGDNNNIFENVISSEMESSKTNIAEAEDDYSFSEFEADFQTACSNTISAESKSTHIQDSFTVEHTSSVATFTSEDKSFDLFFDSSDTGFAKPSDGDTNNALDDMFFVSSSSKHNDTKIMNDSADPFDVWNGFMSSHDKPGNSSVLYEQTSIIKQVDVQDTGSGSFLSSEYFPEAFDHQKGFTEMKDAKLDDSFSWDRLDVTNGETAGSSVTEGGTKSSVDNNVSNLENPDPRIEKLLADMPDLSFMLESNLSVPSKAGDSDLTF